MSFLYAYILWKDSFSFSLLPFSRCCYTILPPSLCCLWLDWFWCSVCFYGNAPCIYIDWCQTLTDAYWVQTQFDSCQIFHGHIIFTMGILVLYMVQAPLNKLGKLLNYHGIKKWETDFLKTCNQCQPEYFSVPIEV